MLFFGSSGRPALRSHSALGGEPHRAAARGYRSSRAGSYFLVAPGVLPFATSQPSGVNPIGLPLAAIAARARAAISWLLRASCPSQPVSPRG